MTPGERAWTDLPCASAYGEGPAALVVPQRVEAEGEEAPRERDAGDLLAAAALDALVPAAQRRVPDGAGGRLAHHPAQPARALLADVAAPGVLIAERSVTESWRGGAIVSRATPTTATRTCGANVRASA